MFKAISRSAVITSIAILLVPLKLMSDPYASVLLHNQELEKHCGKPSRIISALDTYAQILPTYSGPSNDVTQILSEFANHLYCLDVKQLRAWDVLFRDRVFGNENSPDGPSFACASLRRNLNPALIVFDMLKHTLESEFYTTYLENRDIVARCVSSHKVSQFWLDEFGSGLLVDIGQSGFEMLSDALYHPERFGLGGCKLLDHAENNEQFCTRGVPKQLCVNDSADIEDSIFNSPLGKFEMLSWEEEIYGGTTLVTGHSIVINSPRTIFGRSVQSVLANDTDLMKSTCADTQSSSAQSPLSPSAWAESQSCRFREILVEGLNYSNSAENPILACLMEAHGKENGRLTIGPTFTQIGRYDPKCLQIDPDESANGGGDDTSSDAELDRLMEQATSQEIDRTSPEDVRVSSNDARAIYDEVQRLLEQNGHTPTPNRSGADFQRAATVANNAARTARIYSSEQELDDGVYAYSEEIGSPIPDAIGQRLRDKRTNGLTLSTSRNDGTLTHQIFIDTSSGRASRSMRHELHHVMSNELGIDRNVRIPNPLVRVEERENADTSVSVVHAAMRNLGVKTPRPGDDAGPQCFETAAERIARQFSECYRAKELASLIDENPLDPLIYIIDTPNRESSCGISFTQRDGYTDPSPEDVEYYGANNGPNFNNPLVGAIDDCPIGNLQCVEQIYNDIDVPVEVLAATRDRLSRGIAKAYKIQRR